MDSDALISTETLRRRLECSNNKRTTVNGHDIDTHGRLAATVKLSCHRQTDGQTRASMWQALLLPRVTGRPQTDQQRSIQFNSMQLQTYTYRSVASGSNATAMIVGMQVKQTGFQLLLKTHMQTQPFYCSSGICPGPPG